MAAAPEAEAPGSRRPRIGLVSALLPPVIGGTQVLVWRIFQGDPRLAVVSGVGENEPLSEHDHYAALSAPTLRLPYPRLRGYRYGLGPLLGAVTGAWLAQALVRVIAFLRASAVEHVVSIPHQGPFALLGLIAARRLGIPHTLYILDAWEEGAAGPVERSLVRWGLRYAARMPRSRLAVVSPALGAHYRRTFGFDDVTWIPNPAPLPIERATALSIAAATAAPAPFVLFTGGIKPFNVEALRCVVRSLARCTLVQKLVLTGHNSGFAETLQAHAGLRDRVECRLCSPAETAALQAQAAVLLIATNVDDVSQTSLGYLPGRLPEYVSSRRPILLIGPDQSDAARAVRHWGLGTTIAAQDEAKIAELLDRLAATGAGGALPAATVPAERTAPQHDLFLELFSREEARHRLFDEAPAQPLSAAAGALAASFERPFGT